MPNTLIKALLNRLDEPSQRRPRSLSANENESLLDSYKHQKGLYARVARSLRVDASYVSRVANGERHSDKVKQAVLRELARGRGSHDNRPQCPICHDSKLTIVGTKLKMPMSATRANNGHKREMAAYRCTGQHLFLVRNADLHVLKGRQQAA